MSILVGFHVEGWDHLILRAFLAMLLGIPEDLIEPDWIDQPGRGWEFVRRLLPKALRRFYHKCARVAVVGMDNDGNPDLMRRAGARDDPSRPRHWLHGDEGSSAADCRVCQIVRCVEEVRPELNWLPEKHGQDWLVLIAVPVEAIEAWLLVTQALVDRGRGSLHAENEPRHSQKRRFYGKPEPSREDVETMALPLIRRMEPPHLDGLQHHSRSFSHFAAQLNRHRTRILELIGTL